MSYQFNFEAEPFEAYSELDESEFFDTESVDAWQGERSRVRPPGRVAPGRIRRADIRRPTASRSSRRFPRRPIIRPYAGWRESWHLPDESICPTVGLRGRWFREGPDIVLLLDEDEEGPSEDNEMY